jgi:phenylalanine-4-hydroxylase
VSARGFDRIPPHLRGYVLVQDASRYDEVDQQVWRYVLRRVFARLALTAHPAYTSGLMRTGMSVDRIPDIDEMDERLADFGWRAVCVDGFLPPRAFQEFQAYGLLPVNAEIRTPEHVLYTPSPDIIHEAAGHAPILPEPRYAEYLRRIGLIGTRAFASVDDEGVYRAVYQLSEVKDSLRATPGDVARAEQQLNTALAAVRGVSEAAKISRLYWWTAEYGLVGRVNDYQLFGAGLLSSLGESERCHDANVRKIPLSAKCIETDYDITREQPQLFVARDFDHLHAVLEEVAAGLAQRIGGNYALAAAETSGEVATVELDSGAQVTGRIAAVERDETSAVLIRWTGRTGVGSANELFGGATASLDMETWAFLGPLSDGRSASTLQPLEPGAAIDLRFRSGITLRGVLRAQHAHADGRLAAIELASARAARGDRVLDVKASETTRFTFGDRVATAFAGAADASYWPPNEPTFRRVPVPREPRSPIAQLDRAPTTPPSGAYSAGRP